MSDLDTKIDELYHLPLSQFTAARNALARTLSGDEARTVKQLAKPTLVPWAINQLYWNAKPLYTRLLKSGAALRDAQFAALEGGATDVRPASDAHKSALAEAIATATRLAEQHGSHPAADELARTLETLSLAQAHPERLGRLTETLQPAGFEALMGVAPTSEVPAVARQTGRPAPLKSEPRRPRPDKDDKGDKDRERKARAAAEQAREREAEAARELARRRLEAEQARKRAAAIKAAEKALERAQTVEAQARRELDRAQEEVRAAERALADARRR